MIKVVTHSGSFHSDDVFAVATLQLFYGVENVEVFRTRNEEVMKTADVVVDVGGIYDVEAKRFDHHQNGAPVRQNSIPYAAFGLVWKEFGTKVCGSEAVASEVDRLIVNPVDAGDTGVSLYTLGQTKVAPYELYQVVSSFAPEWGSDKDKDMAFLEAVNFARELLVRIIKQKTAEVSMRKLVSEVYQNTRDKRVLVFDVPVSSLSCIEYKEVLMMVCPDDSSGNSNWTATTIRENCSSFKSRVSFPENWAGLRNEELASVSKIKDAVFCHKARFIFVGKSKEGVLLAARKALEANGCRFKFFRFC
jgi:uncharacterized UPF0160 family protein